MRKAFTFLFIISATIFNIQAQTKTITGTVISGDDNTPMIGAAVVVKGTTIGMLTDIDGKYSINVPDNATTLVFSFVGMKTQEIAIENHTTIDVILKSDVFKMDEVVVAGVASATPKRDLSVSVSKVDSKELDLVPATSASSALEGKVAGVTIVSGNGNPGESSDIRLRGTNSLLEDQSPLIIIDGVQFEGNLADINADDIESIEIVKGASASALYGSKAGSGVLVITTKRGKSNNTGADIIVVRNEYGNSDLIKEIGIAQHSPYMLASDYAQPGYTKYAGVTYPIGYAGGYYPAFQGNLTVDYDHYVDNPYSFTSDPQKELFKLGKYYTNYISLSSGGEKTSYFTSFENNYNSGIVFNSNGSSRQNFKINIDHKISDILNISSSTLITQNTIDMPASDITSGDPISNEKPSGGQGSPFYNALILSPDVNLNMNSPDSMILKKYYDKPDQWSNGENPLHALYYEKRTQNRRDILQNFHVNLNPASWINFDADYSFEKQNTDFTIIEPVGFQSGGVQNDGYEYKSYYDFFSQTFQFTTNLQKKFGDLVTKGKLSYLFEKYPENYFYGSGTDMMATGLTSMGNLMDKNSFVMNSLEDETIAKDYFGILDLDYKEKYIASVLYRLDGSSLFGPESRWNPYYRLSFAYRLNEDLHLNGFQELKLRFATGTSGQRPGFYYQYETYPVQTNTAILNGGTSANPNLKPADTKEEELGLNAQFLNNFELEIVRSQAITSGIFFQKQLPAVTGFSNVWWNAASTESNTWEATLGAQLIKIKDLDWNMNLTFDKVSQKVTQLATASQLVGPAINGTQVLTIHKNSDVGEIDGEDWVRSLAQMENQLPQGKTINDYTVNSDGYVILKGTEGTPNEKPILLDQNNDGIPDILKIGDFNPDFNMSVFSQLTWKNFGLSMLWVWKQGGSIYNLTKQWMYLNLSSSDVDQAGKPDYEKKAYDYYTTFYDGLALNKYFVEDGTYVKLREVSLYYNITPKTFSGLGVSFIKKGRIGLLGRNLLTFTRYSGWDPEVATPDPNGFGGTSYAMDIFNYPNYRTYSVSLELTF